MEPGDTIAWHTLVEEIASIGWYIHVWRAQDGSRQDAVLWLFETVTGDDSLAPRIHDLWGDVAPLRRHLMALTRLEAMPGVAPWQELHMPYRGRTLMLRRRWSPEMLTDRFPPAHTQNPDGTPARLFLEEMQDLAAGMDALHRTVYRPESPLRLLPRHLFMDGDSAVIADYGLDALIRVIEDSYDGPRPMYPLALAESLCYPDLAVHRASVAVDPVFALASVYFFLRTGHGAFARSVPSPDVPVVQQLPSLLANREYLQTGQLDLSALPHPAERAIVARGMALNPADRYPRCADFAHALIRL